MNLSLPHGREVGRRTTVPPLHLFHVFPTFGTGGVAIRMCDMMDRLGPFFRHTILALDGNTVCRERLSAGTDASFVTIDIDKRRQLTNLFHFTGVLRRLRPDLLLTYNWGAVEWSLVDRLARVCPNIHFESGFGPEEVDRQIRRRVLARRIALAGAAAVVVPSMRLVEISTRVWGLEPRQVLHVPNGVDCDRFAASPGPLAGFEKEPGETIVGTVAPLRPEKNLARLIDAFATVEGAARLLIVGDGPDRPRLEATAAARGVAHRVVFAGHIARPETVFGHLDVFAISSDTEQMPNSVLQAMAAARPIVGVDVGDVKEMVSAPNRPFITRRGDDGAFAAALSALVHAARARADLGAANRAHVVSTYGIVRMVERYDSLIRNAVAQRRPLRLSLMPSAAL